MNTIKTLTTIAIAAASIGASARTVTVALDGDWYLQAGTVTSSTDLVRVFDGVAVIASHAARVSAERKQASDTPAFNAPSMMVMK